jgi:predicted RNA-binding protein
MEQMMQEVTDSTLSSQEAHLERMMAFREEMKMRHETMMINIKGLRGDIKGNQQKMEVLLEGLRSCGKWTTACQVVSEACLEIIEATMVTFEESSDKMEAADLMADPKAMEAIVKRQELRNKKINVDAAIGGSTHGSMLGCTAPPMGEQADPRK